MAATSVPTGKEHVHHSVAKYLVSGESVMWQGRPATIVILGKGLLLTILSVIYMITLWIDHAGAIALATAVVASLLMIVVDRRLGLLAGLSGIVILAAFGLGLNDKYLWLVIVPLGFALIALLINIIYLGRVLFLVTDHRIITRYGIFSLRYADLGIEKLQNVTVIQPWYERILGYGDVYFATAGEKGGIDYERPGLKLMSGGAITWENVGKPFDVVRLVNGIVHQDAVYTAKAPQQPVYVPQPPPAPAPKPSGETEEKLKQLGDLRQKGLITEEEYQQKRAELLKNL